MVAPMAGSDRGRRRFRPMSEINVTPLVDVMLVLLVVFMITAPLLTVGVPIDLPETEAAQLTDREEPLVVSVKAKEVVRIVEGTVYIQETEVPLDQLVAKLTAIMEARRDSPVVYVRGDRAIHYGRVMEVMGELQAGGFRTVVLLAKLPDKGRLAVMHFGLLLSTLAHASLLLLAVVGLPALHDPPDPVEMPIAVEVLIVSERTEAKAPLPPKEVSTPEPPAPVPEPVEAEALPEEPVEVAALPPEPPIPEPPVPEPVEAEAPPEEPVEVAALSPEPPMPEPPPKPEAAPTAAPPPPPEPQPEELPAAPEHKPPPLPQRAPQQQARTRPPPPPEEPPRPAPVPEPAPPAVEETPPDELAALRQAARPDELDTLRSAVSDDAQAAHEEAPEPTFTVSEIHRLFQQLSGCWQTIPGLAPSERHVVVLEVRLGPDRRIRSVEAVDAKSSHSYRAARERAERALRHPSCEQLDVPADKIRHFESLTLRFDPHELQ